MPELPEVETVMKGLSPFLCHHHLTKIDIRSPALRHPIPKKKIQQLIDIKILKCWRRAKYILVEFSNGKILVLHLGMTGSYTVYPDRSQPFPQLDRHDHLVLTTEENARIIYRDPRRFGSIDVVDQSEIEQYPSLAHLGPEPLEDDFTADVLYAALAKRHGPIKPVLMDQKIVVGVGNIYASEALYLSRIHPGKPASSLKKKEVERLVGNIKSILCSAIQSGGSTLRDYRQVGGEVGYFQFSFSVYDKEGEACPDCTCSLKKTGGIQRIVQAGRSTFFCPTRQKPVA